MAFEILPQHCETLSTNHPIGNSIASFVGGIFVTGGALLLRQESCRSTLAAADTWHPSALYPGKIETVYVTMESLPSPVHAKFFIEYLYEMPPGCLLRAQFS